MKVIITKYAAACLLLYTSVLSVIVFWQTSNMVMGILAIVAVVGWLAWWVERFVMAEVVTSPSDDLAAILAMPASFLARQKAKRLDANSAQGQAADKGVACPPNQMAGQVRIALDEAEEAVSLSIEAFQHIVFEAGEMSQCAREMQSWGSEKSPLLSEALSHLAARSSDIGKNAQSIVITFQFHDLMRQRLENIAAYLDTIPDAAGRETESTGMDGSEFHLPNATVSYALKSGAQDDVTLF